MRILFFNRADKSGRAAFRSYYVLQNLKTVQVVSLIYFIFCILIRTVFYAYNLSDQTIHHINEYDYANWTALIIVPFFYAASFKFTRHFKSNPKFLKTAQALVILFSMFIITCAMRASFFSMHNPRNTLVMYMMGLIIVGVFYTFEYYETIFVALATGIVFIIILPFYQHSFSELVLNNLASLLLVTAFFCISRYFFSYRADNFFKLKAIEQKNVEIENASQLKNEILGVVAHDLRNPLSIIKSAAALMEMEENTNQENNDYLQMINASCDKAAAIINDLLETAENELNEFELENTDLDTFLSAIIDEWAKNKKGQVNILYKNAGHPVYAGINPEKMQRVMDNLISNAIKFSGKNDNIEISLSDTANAIFITVKDFGIGIPAEMLPYIFDRFSKARRNGIRGEASVGLGLSIVRQIVIKHGGEIEVSSNNDTGTSFAISLPKTFA